MTWMEYNIEGVYMVLQMASISMWRFACLPALAVVLQAAAIPRPEYPEPQFERQQWLSLNGSWEFALDDSATPPQRLARTITVPFSPESKLGGISDPSFHSSMWYRRGFTIPADWKGRQVMLHFGAVNYWATVWVNNSLAGRHEGGNTPFAFDITNLLNGSANNVTVHAEYPPTDRYIPRGKQFWEPKSRGIFYTRTTGIWQSVWIEPVSTSHLETVKVTPNMDGTASIYAHIAGARTGLALRTAVSFGGQPVVTTSVTADNPRVSTSVTVSDPKLWSTGTPNLYDVTFELVQGERVVDLVKSYFGFRSVSTENGRVILNGRPIFLKMVLDQGYWPDSILTPPSDEAIQYDIKMTKDMGFNGARKHQKLEDPRYLYWADKMGLLVSSEMANAYLFDDQAVERFTREWMNAVKRDYNHPSIIIWAPLNESWGVPNVRDPRQQDYLKELYTLTRALDSSRLVIDNEGWEHTNMTDLFAIHDYARTGDLLSEKYRDLGKLGAGVPDNARPALAPGYKYNGSPVVLSEFGGIAFIPPGHEVPPESWGYSGVEKTGGAVLERLRGLYQAIAKIRGFAGLCYTQLTDVEQEVNGLMTYDRKSKFDVSEIRAINALVN